MTYPLIRVDDPALPDFDDAAFSVWRIAWIAHQLRSSPGRLFDANVFHPEPLTLAYSDAMVAIGGAAAPAIWLGLHPVVAHNLLLLAAFATAGLASYALAHELTGSRTASLTAGIIFAFAPYRFGHIGHLELLWTAPMPLALLILHRATSDPRPWRSGIVLGGVLALQAYCSVYYAAFLVIFVAVWAMATAAMSPAPARRRAVATTAIGLAVAMAAASPYASVYSQVRETMGPRSTDEIRQFSASPGDYLRVSHESNVYPDALRSTSDELALFPGAVATVLALAGVIGRRDRLSALYGVLAACAFLLSLGLNGVLYPLLVSAVPPLAGLRAPARFGSLVLLAVSVLAALGLRSMLGARTGRWRTGLAAGVVAACLVEYWCAPIAVRRMPLEPPPVSVWLRSASPRAIVELPIPEASRLWGYETTHQYLSIYHWTPLVNGYSGYAPRSYVRTLDAMRTFPSAGAVTRLRELGVELVVVHERLYAPEAFAALVDAMLGSGAFEAPQTFPDAVDPALVFRLKAATGATAAVRRAAPSASRGGTPRRTGGRRPGARRR